MGWVGLGHLGDVSGWVESWEMDPRTTLGCPAGTGQWTGRTGEESPTSATHKGHEFS